MIRGFGAVLAKDLRLLARDRAGLVFLTLAPVIVISVAGFSLASLYGADPQGSTAHVLPVADEDGGQVGRAIRERLAGESRVRAEVVAGRDAARARLRAQEAGAALVVPAGTTRAVREGRPAELVLYTDPVKYLEIANVRALVQELRHGVEAGLGSETAARLPGVRLPGPIEIREESVTGAPERINTFDQNVPGFSVTFLLLGMLLGVSLGILDERHWGTFERLRSMPIDFSAVLVGKLFARFLVGVVQMIVLFLVGWGVFGVSLGPEPWALILPITGIVFAGTTFGLVVAGVARSREAVLPLGSIAIVTMAAVGGCWWPIDLEPSWMRKVALAFPTTWAMAAFNDLMIRRQPLEAALWPSTVLFAYGLGYLGVGLALFRRSAGR